MTDNASAATQHIMNALMTVQAQTNKQKPANKTMFNPWKMITTMNRIATQCKMTVRK